MPDANAAERTLTLVTPVFNDWESLGVLVDELDRTLAGQPVRVRVLVVDDGSSEPAAPRDRQPVAQTAIDSIDILRLPFNMGHQRAIALGLSEVAAGPPCDAVLIMDADGEDKPADVPRLIAEHAASPDAIIVAQRARRSEGAAFTLFYSIYKLVFRVLTGNWIDFGNFSLIPWPVLTRIVGMPEAWNHLAATYVRVPAPLVTIPTDRGHRYRGKSTMNMPSLVFHAICAMSVFAETLFARILIAAASLSVLSVIAIAAVLGIRLFTELAIPGWATYSAGLLFIFLVQLLILLLGAAFLLVNHRSNIASNPAQLRQTLAGKLVLTKDPQDGRQSAAS